MTVPTVAWLDGHWLEDCWVLFASKGTALQGAECGRAGHRGGMVTRQGRPGGYFDRSGECQLFCGLLFLFVFLREQLRATRSRHRVEHGCLCSL